MHADPTIAAPVARDVRMTDLSRLAPSTPAMNAW
jgi:hypothetical protein